MRRAIFVVLSLAAAACGGSSATTGDVQKFSALASNVSGAATTYQTQATATTDIPSCNQSEDAYDGQVRPMVEQMQQMSGRMDDYMRSNDHMGDADMGCTSDAMMAELDRHKAAACASSDMAIDHAEAQQHVQSMLQWAAHAQSRASEMGSMMGMGGMMDGGPGGTTAGTCHHNSDGTYSM